jgi:hypothetical protein
LNLGKAGTAGVLPRPGTCPSLDSLSKTSPGDEDRFIEDVAAEFMSDGQLRVSISGGVVLDITTSRQRRLVHVECVYIPITEPDPYRIWKVPTKLSKQILRLITCVKGETHGWGANLHPASWGDEVSRLLLSSSPVALREQ